jgi:hypothetical protein
VKPRFLALATAVLLLPPASLRAGTSTLREQSQQVVEARGLTGLKIENPRGLVRVRPSRDGRIHVTALKLTTASEDARARAFSRDTRVETSTEAGRFVVRVRYPQRQTIRVNLWRLFKGGFDFPGVEVRLSVEAPDRLPVELETASGDLETSDLAGAQVLRTTSGDIEVRGAGAPITASTTSGNVMVAGLARARVRSVSGDVSLEDARGALDVRTTSGDLEVRGATDSLALSTVSGDIRVDRAPRGIDAGTTSGQLVVEGPAAGVVTLRTVSGGVRVGLDRGLRRAGVNTVSGDIQVGLPEGFGCDLTLTSSSGTLDSAVPLTIRTVSRREMSGVVRGGGPPVVLRSTSGDIAVTGGGR